ncbi:MAG: phosphate transport system regulatory protein PhoU [Planctomycetota bacterium]|nr:MAG: phosphate transport system regulatory protein PhoU [Planctomycetota bacterium]
MTKHFFRDLEQVNKELLALGAFVETAIHRAILALVDRRGELAEDVIQGDAKIDEREVALEGEVLKLLALHQPVASDLRFLVTVLKVNNDLERMGDLAVNIAKRARRLCKQDPLPVDLPISDLTEKVRNMVRESLDALIESDLVLARNVILSDDGVDQLTKDVFKIVKEAMTKDPSMVERGLHLISATRNLERIGDLATNIAEDVIFMAEGTIMRHRIESFDIGEEQH